MCQFLAQQLTLILKTTIMSDNKMNIGGADRRRISLDEDYEVRYWANKLALPATN